MWLAGFECADFLESPATNPVPCYYFSGNSGFSGLSYISMYSPELSYSHINEILSSTLFKHFSNNDFRKQDCRK